MTDFRTYAYKITNPEVHKVKLTCCGDFTRTVHLLSQFQSLIALAQDQTKLKIYIRGIPIG